MTTPQKLQKIRKELEARFYERADAIDGLILAILSGQHAFILGPPGTGKSLLVRELVSRITGATYFETVLSKNRPDAAVLGPYDMGALRDRSDFIRKDAGFLTTVDFAFLDEIGKASPTLGHDLLPALNERIKHEVANGRSAHPIPLRTAFTASNELPAADSEDMAALWDRLLVRIEVDYLRSPSTFRRLIESSGGASKRTTIPLGEVDLARDEVANLPLSGEAIEAIISLRASLLAEGLRVSDRRWRDSVRLIQATAWLREAQEAEVQDIVGLRFALWETPSDANRIHRMILAVARPESEEVAQLADLVEELNAEALTKRGLADDKVTTYVLELRAKIATVIRNAERLEKQLTSARAKAELEGVVARAEQVLEDALANSPLSFASKIIRKDGDDA